MAIETAEGGELVVEQAPEPEAAHLAAARVYVDWAWVSAQALEAALVPGSRAHVWALAMAERLREAEQALVEVEKHLRQRESESSPAREGQ